MFRASNEAEIVPPSVRRPGWLSRA